MTEPYDVEPHDVRSLFSWKRISYLRRRLKERHPGHIQRRSNIAIDLGSICVFLFVLYRLLPDLSFSSVPVALYRILRLVSWCLIVDTSRFALYDIERWIHAIRITGLPSLATLRKLHACMVLTEQGPGTILLLKASFVGAGIGVVLSLLLGTLPRELPLAIFLGAVTAYQGFLIPPLVLVLARSGETAVAIQTALYYTLGTYRVVSLIDIGEQSTHHLRNESYRLRKELSDDGSWRGVVESFAAMTPVIVLDAREDTEHLRFETEVLLHDSRIARTLFLVGDAGEQPLLDHVGISPSIAASKGMTRITSRDLVPAVQRMLE
jgi:hypothetical protein